MANGEPFLTYLISCLVGNTRDTCYRRDAGMTTWGCTPTCRGFQHFFGFYNAFNDYFTHRVGNFLDLRNDTTPVRDLTGDYFTETVTAEAIRWLTASLTAEPNRSTFVYLAHQSNHGPLQVPQRYIDGQCAARIPLDKPSRRIICGMMRAVDDSLANLTNLYQSLGDEVWESTVIIFSTDNGGPTEEGGNNAPLRGQKATSYEGGVRGVGWVGGGLPAVRRGAVSRAMIHVSDLYPTIVHGIAGLEIGVTADGTPPLDGVDAWPSITSASVASPRTEMLLQLNAGSQAIRVGKYKIIVGMAGGPSKAGSVCTAHQEKTCSTPKCFPYNISLTTAAPMCHNGWVPPPESGKLPEPPPGVGCPALPCSFPNSSYTSSSDIQLFDIEADPSERNDLSEEKEFLALRQQLITRLQTFVDKAIPQDHGRHDPASNPANFGGVWTPWLGDPVPAHCAKPPLPSPPPVPAPDKPCEGDGEIGDGTINLLPEHPGKCTATGWCSDQGYSGPAREAVVAIDGKVIDTGIANVSKHVAGFHGLDITFDCSVFAHGNHTASVGCKCLHSNEVQVLRRGKICTNGPPARVVPCLGAPPDLLQPL